MNLPQKIHKTGGTIPPLRQLKLRCRDNPADGDWAFGLRNRHSNAEARAAILEKFGIAISDDSKYARFCAWWHRQKEWDILGELAEMDEAALQKRFPNLSRENVRAAAILRSYVAAELKQDDKLRLNVIKVDADEQSGRFKGAMEDKKFDQRERALMQEREKWLAAQRTKIEAGLDALYLEVKDNAEAQELFQKFKDVATKSTT
ncbi:MAG TPA: hypothetical protein VFT34_01540 [Verrucomicrobiae bacterium]|nr:hypothetical protein [Verrucomicrobiae bacterium]